MNIAKSDSLCFYHLKRLHEGHPDIPAYFIEHGRHDILLDKSAELTQMLKNILGTLTK